MLCDILHQHLHVHLDSTFDYLMETFLFKALVLNFDHLDNGSMLSFRSTHHFNLLIITN